MFASQQVPGVTVQEVSQKLAQGESFILLDVREPTELRFANLGDGVTHVPMSEMAKYQLAALPEDVRTEKAAEIIVMCHHGNRSAQVTMWLRQQGWTNVWNMDGGIDAYAIAVDPSVGRY